jgi:hemoglobin
MSRESQQRRANPIQPRHSRKSASGLGSLSLTKVLVAGYKTSTMSTTSSLYERLGGVYAIAAVVDDFIDRIMDDPRLNANPQVDAAHHRVSRAGFKYLVTEQVCQATGGPQRYTGRTMSESHAHLAITEPEWQVFLADLRQTLDKFQVPAAEQRELLDIVESTKQDIVVA